MITLNLENLVSKYRLNADAMSDYLMYINYRDEAALLRVEGKTHHHEYFIKHPSCQNRRYMDRESQYFIKNRLAYNGLYPITDAVFQLIFRKAATYDYVKQKTGLFPGDLIKMGAKNPLIKIIQELPTAFTGAYLVPHRDKNASTKIEGWLNAFDCYNFEMLSEIKSSEKAYQELRSIPGFGDFIAMQFTTELGWLDQTLYGGNEFVIPGNGAVRGLNKLGVSKHKYQQFLMDLVRLQPNKSKWIPMTLMDYQNTFCEFDKFTRYLGGYDNQGRERMKRNRKAHAEPIKSFLTTNKLRSESYHKI